MLSKRSHELPSDRSLSVGTPGPFNPPLPPPPGRTGSAAWTTINPNPNETVNLSVGKASNIVQTKNSSNSGASSQIVSLPERLAVKPLPEIAAVATIAVEKHSQNLAMDISIHPALPKVSADAEKAKPSEVTPVSISNGTKTHPSNQSSGEVEKTITSIPLISENPRFIIAISLENDFSGAAYLYKTNNGQMVSGIVVDWPAREPFRRKQVCYLRVFEFSLHTNILCRSQLPFITIHSNKLWDGVLT